MNNYPQEVDKRKLLVIIHTSMKNWIKRLFTWSLGEKTHQLTRSSLPSYQYGPSIIFSIHLLKVEGYHPSVMIPHTPQTKVNRFRYTSPICSSLKYTNEQCNMPRWERQVTRPSVGTLCNANRSLSATSFVVLINLFSASIGAFRNCPGRGLWGLCSIQPPSDGAQTYQFEMFSSSAPAGPFKICFSPLTTPYDSSN